MSLCVSYQGVENPLVVYCQSIETKGFVCKAGNGAFEISYPLAIDASYDPNKFVFSLLANNELVENDIYQVYDTIRKCRIGWCFPIQALGSTEHSFAEDEHFLKYAYVAAQKILYECPEDVFTLNPSLRTFQKLQFAEFFPENVAVLVVSLEALDEETDFNVEEWLPSLYMQGYALVSSRDASAMTLFGQKPRGTRMDIYKVSPKIGKAEFITKIFKELLPYESNPAFCFFYYYQIVELILSHIFQVEQKSIVDQLIEVSSDTIKTKELLRKSGEISSEAYRLNLLTGHYMSKSVHVNDIKNSCNELLSSLNWEHVENPIKAFYAVRNVIFHQYRDISRIDLLCNIITDMPRFVAEVLHYYHGERIN